MERRLLFFLSSGFRPRSSWLRRCNWKPGIVNRAKYEFKKKNEKTKNENGLFSVFYHSVFNFCNCWDEIKRHRKHIFYEYWIKWLKLNIITLTSGHNWKIACCSSPLKLSSSKCSVSSAAAVASPSFEAVIGLLAMLEDWRIADEGFPC